MRILFFRVSHISHFPWRCPAVVREHPQYFRLHPSPFQNQWKNSLKIYWNLNYPHNEVPDPRRCEFFFCVQEAFCLIQGASFALGAWFKNLLKLISSFLLTLASFGLGFVWKAVHWLNQEIFIKLKPKETYKRKKNSPISCSSSFSAKNIKKNPCNIFLFIIIFTGFMNLI